jgi:hypothetical protein
MVSSGADVEVWPSRPVRSRLRAEHPRVLESPERVTVIAVLGRPRGRHRDWLYRTLSFSPSAIDEAVRCLEAAGLVITTACTVRASPALMLLDGLRLIGV